MEWPQIVIIVSYAISIFVSAALDGTPRGGKHSFALTLIGSALGSWVLYMGGFWG